MKEYDAIIIGAGHNGLVCADYLVRKGLKVLALERRHLVGGACVTEPVFPGCKVSPAAYVVGLLHPKIVSDLELEKHGYQVLPRDPPSFTPFLDERHLFMWRDQKKTLEEIAKFSTKDADAYVKYESQLDGIAKYFDEFMLTIPPNLLSFHPKDLFANASLLWKTAKLGKKAYLLPHLFSDSVKNYLEKWFESQELMSTLATDGVIGFHGGVSHPGSAYVLLHHVMGEVNNVRGRWGFVKGGMGALTHAMCESGRAYGLEVKTNAEVSSIIIKNNQAKGVVLADGTELYAKKIISNADPKVTFLQLAGRENLSPEFAQQIDHIDFSSSSAKVMFLVDALPNYISCPGTSGPQHVGTAHICENLDYMERAFDDAKYGSVSSNPMLELTIQTAVDDSIAPKGQHIISVFFQHAPYSTVNVEEQRATLIERCKSTISKYAPNFENSIIDAKAYTPADFEKIFGLTGGNLFHGSMTPSQLFFMRPVPDCAQYKTPIKSLYLCGSGSHPGGGVTGIPGLNAARVVLREQ